ncbi:hypothetical protein [Novosphingobium terrae]|uniref:hypothetical protein n=1 Tax=Novosphingobium terrae TaxID=2726189 RepID=UPI0019821FBD|nr:hypothetical protein [Novosphingobium terrae]
MAQHQRAGVQDPLDKVEKVMRISGEADERDNPGHEREAGEDGIGRSPVGAPRQSTPRDK